MLQLWAELTEAITRAARGEAHREIGLEVTIFFFFF